MPSHYKRLEPGFFIGPCSQDWPQPLFVAVDDKDLSKGYRAFTGPGGHCAGEYGYPLYVEVTPAVEIEICERAGDHWVDHEGEWQPVYHAQIAGEPSLQATGRSEEAAIGSLVRTHADRFGIKVSVLPWSAH